MKTLLTILFSLFCIGVLAQNPPSIVENNFKAKYPNAIDPEWFTDEDEKLSVYFYLNEVAKTAIYSPDGTWFETKTTLNTDMLPDQIAAAVGSKYPTYTTNGVTMSEFPNSPTQYEVNLDSKDKMILITYDQHAKIINIQEETIVSDILLDEE